MLKERVVSIIVPIYNCEAFLSDCVNSMLNQTYPDVEIVLVDDGSKDRSGEICDCFAKNNKNIVVIHQTNSGVAKARQVGVLHSTGKYVLFVDSDDQIEENYIETLVNVESKSNSDIIISGYKCQSKEKEFEYKQFFPEGKYSKTDLENVIYPQMLSATPFYTFGISPAMWGKLFKASVVKKNLKALDSGIFFGEDGCFVYSVLLDCDSIYITENTGYVYQYNEASVTRKFNPKLLDDNIKLKAFYENLSKEKNWDISTQLDEYMAYICNYTVTFALKAPNTVPNREVKEYIKKIYPINIHKNAKFRRSSLRNKIKFLLIKIRFINILKKLLK